MKKRILSLVLILAVCFSSVPAAGVLAAQKDTAAISTWAQKDLKIGDTYGIYPKTWYDKGMTARITQGQLRVLIAGLRSKILNSGYMEKENNVYFILDKYLTVEEVLEVLHTVISSYQFTKDIGLKNYSAVKFMKKYGLYTGKNGELALSDQCTIEQACVIVTRLVSYLYDVLDAGSKGFLWKLQSGGNTVYLLGSIHMATYDIYPYSKTMLQAYQSSDALAVELNLYDISGAMQLAQLAVYSDGTTLKDHVSPETYQKTIELAAKLGYPQEQIIMLKPWYLYSLFSSLVNTEAGNSEEVSSAAALGIDMYFTTDALTTGKPILEVEGALYQGKVLDGFSDELEEYLLNETVDSINQIMSGTYSEGFNYLQLMLKYWKEGNTEAFQEFTSPKFEYPQLYEEDVTEEEKALIAEFQDKLITQRDKGMADYIDRLLKTEGSRTYFVVVGSNHLISDFSVIDILKEKGYDISQIK